MTREERREIKQARDRSKEIAQDLARGETNTALGKMMDDIENDRGLPPCTDSLRKMFG